MSWKFIIIKEKEDDEASNTPSNHSTRRSTYLTTHLTYLSITKTYTLKNVRYMKAVPVVAFISPSKLWILKTLNNRGLLNPFSTRKSKH